MHTRSRLVVAGLVVGLLVAGFSGAQDRPPEKPRQPGNVETLDRRLAELEASLAKALKEVQGLRTEIKTLAPSAKGRHEVRIFALKNAEARQAFQKGLELDPNRVWIKQQLDKTPAQ